MLYNNNFSGRGVPQGRIRTHLGSWPFWLPDKPIGQLQMWKFGNGWPTRGMTFSQEGSCQSFAQQLSTSMSLGLSGPHLVSAPKMITACLISKLNNMWRWRCVPSTLEKTQPQLSYWFHVEGNRFWAQSSQVQIPTLPPSACQTYTNYLRSWAESCHLFPHGVIVRFRWENNYITHRIFVCNIVLNKC